MELHIQLTGTKPILLHNERLANPLDPIVQELKKITGKRNKTEEDYVRMMELEMQGGIYETPEGLLGVPTGNVWKSIQEGAKANKRGKDIDRALTFADVIEPLEQDGAKVRADDFLHQDDPSPVFYRSVVIQGKRTMRARPLVRQWSTTHHFDLATDVIDVGVVEVALARAGRYVGLCDWRPRYGTYEWVIR